MRCKIFTGPWGEAQCAFNKWAKGKVLTREVLIHTHATLSRDDEGKVIVTIIVYHPEGKEWDATEHNHTAVEMVNQHIIGHQSAQEVT